ncbi:uncharacterized protein LOC128890608 [Hylaeus anthracinus]|uniref:uncharacterized protein LOC128890608 n=1 Tax=Hylaeus anthracinus TaxID=313031 RepID=UPI0023B91F7D|nr:uncharacterized protein LOC128890608 [Hylaeus anthracinus]
MTDSYAIIYDDRKSFCFFSRNNQSGFGVRFASTMDAKTVIRRYLKTTKTFTQLCGLWCYQSTCPKYFARLVVLIFSIITTFMQVAKVVISDSSDALYDQCPFLCMAFLILAKIYHYAVNEARFKVIMDDIFHDWKAIKSKAEYDIMNIYGERAVFITTLYLMNGIISSITFIQIPLVPLVLDIVAPLNVSRGIGYMFPAYYFVDEHRYYYLIVAHMIIAVSGVLIFNVAFDSTYMYIVQHACGLLAVSGFRFRNAIQATVVQKEKDVDNDTYRNISKMKYCMDYLKYLAFFSVQLVHLLVLTIQGQFVTNAGNDIHDAICESFWYNGSCRTQALYILVLRRSLVYPQFTGRIVPMNLRSFAEIVKVSVSYFTVLQST